MKPQTQRTPGPEARLQPSVSRKSVLFEVADKLLAYGFKVEAQVAEDWGWWSGIVNEGYELSHACRCDNENGDFVVFTHPATPVIRRWFRKIDISGRLDPLNEAIFSILAQSGKAMRGPTWVD